MGAIEWDSSLETGDPTIDGQHQRLFGLVNELRDACVEGRGREATASVIDRLVEYVGSHFDAEQALMVRTTYPPDAMIAHITEHRDLTRRTAEIVAQEQRGELTTVLPLAEFLHEWLRTHIRQTDRALVAHVLATERT